MLLVLSLVKLMGGVNWWTPHLPRGTSSNAALSRNAATTAKAGSGGRVSSS